jgi:uncharacterized OB-fold protein
MTAPLEDEAIVVPSLGIALGGSQGISPETSGHWAAAAEGRFTVPTCDDCGVNRWPITHACYACGSRNWSWQTVPGTGVVYTYTWIDTPTHYGADLSDANIAVIELDGTKGESVRVPGWVVDIDRDTLVCGLPVVAEFETVADGVAVPHWRRR